MTNTLVIVYTGMGASIEVILGEMVASARIASAQ